MALQFVGKDDPIVLYFFPKATMVITKDFDWMSVVSEEAVIPDAEELCARVLASHIICEDDGVITLKKRTLNLSSESDLTLNPIYGSFGFNDSLSITSTNSGTFTNVPREGTIFLPSRLPLRDNTLRLEFMTQKEDKFPTNEMFAWPPEIPRSPAGYLYQSRKTLPIKRNDAEPLTRKDVQYDLLTYLFSDPNEVFTHPDLSRKEKVSFGDLYVHALYTSSRCSKVWKDKMHETPAFSVEFAKLALLTNVGRINTTMAFFPEMKTALRTYHPVPSLQTTVNAQDAPRIKNCLKAALLPSEVKATPYSPDEILHKLKEGHRPPTSVVNLIFVLANHAESLYFGGQVNFLDLFLPNTYLASADRARVILWHLYHYLESNTGPNPFDDHYSARHPGNIPTLRTLSLAEYQRENIDTEEEIEWGNTMSHRRNVFLQSLIAESDKRIKPRAHYVTASGKSMPRSQRQLLDEPADERSFLFYLPSQEVVEPEGSQTSYHHSSAEGPRSMFQEAWHGVKTTDPLIDSDDEDMSDYDMQIDITRRLDVLSQIRERSSAD